MRISFLMILDCIFEHFPILKQLPDFSSYHVFWTYLGFETITGINVNAFTHLRNKIIFFETLTKNKSKLFFYNLKIIKALRNQNISIVGSYNIDLTKNAGNCLLKMLENKSSIFCILTDKMWNLDSRNNLEVLHNIIFVFCDLFCKLWTWNLFWIMDYT